MSGVKHIFIVNPIAGKGRIALSVAEDLEKYRKEHDIEVYYTKSKGDASEYVRSRLEGSAEDESLRFYACGGDGSINEVATGIMRSGRSNGAMGVYPCGSGNDFVKAIGGSDKYADIGALLESPERQIDIIRMGNRYAVNAVHFGFDSCVAKVMGAVRHKKFVGGKNSYATGVAVAFFTAMKNKCRIIADGEVIHNGNFLLCTLANGQYVGGKYRCAPYSRYDDGEIEVCIVSSISRLRFLKLMNYYERGEHIGSEKFKDIISYRRAKKLEIKAEGDFAISLDGEIVNENNAEVEILPGALKFVIPD